MSLLEGFSDYVMDEVGRDLVPDVERISARFHERRARRTPFERAMLRLTGMDLKLEQYKKGEIFVRAIADARGKAALDAPVGGARDAAARRRDRRIRSAGSRASSTAPPARRREPVVTSAGPGRGPGGAPAAIALSPILSARYRSRDLERIRAAAPGARLVTVSVEGLADGPLDDVEVMLRGWLSSDAFDRLLARAPRPRLGPLGDVGRGARPDAGGPRARRGRHERPRRLQPARSPSTC